MELRKIIFLAICLLLPGIFAKAQNYAGIWQGYITASESLNSGYVLHVKSQETDMISGRAYIYRRNYFAFEGILDFIGTINRNTLKITELTILNSRLPNDSTMFLCIKFMNLQFSRQNNIDNLYGNWDGSTTERIDCIPGQVYLHRFMEDNPDEEPIPEQIAEKIRMDLKPTISFLNTELAKPVIITVNSSMVELEISDYLRQDFDTVSVFYNRKLIVKNLPIAKKPRKFRLYLEKVSGLNEIVMYANNLGLIPPNTSMLVVDDGIRRQKVNIESTREKSAVIYLNYQAIPRRRSL